MLLSPRDTLHTGFLSRGFLAIDPTDGSPSAVRPERQAERAKGVGMPKHIALHLASGQTVGLLICTNSLSSGCGTKWLGTHIVGVAHRVDTYLKYTMPTGRREMEAQFYLCRVGCCDPLLEVASHTYQT